MAKTNVEVNPPIEIATEFLGALRATLTEHDNIVPVLRGSMLLKHWFGDAARPAADIDLECHFGPRGPDTGRFRSLCDYGKAICTWAAISRGPNSAIEFTDTDSTAGPSLWDSYGTPGERWYTGWIWHSRDGIKGRLQIDVAEAGSYDLASFGTAEIELCASDGKPFPFPAYTPESMLAAKLSWLLRSLERQQGPDGPRAPKWTGEPKDLFDVHLLLTRAKLNAEAFAKSLLAVATEDKLDWSRLEALFDAPRAAMSDADFPNWNVFREAHAPLIEHGPAEMLRISAERLEPLLRDLRQHLPFLRAIKADPVDEVPYLICADWLEERADARADFLRLYISFHFRQEELSPQELSQTRQALAKSLQAVAGPWLYHLFGSAERFREFKKRVESQT